MGPLGRQLVRIHFNLDIDVLRLVTMAPIIATGLRHPILIIKKLVTLGMDAEMLLLCRISHPVALVEVPSQPRVGQG